MKTFKQLREDVDTKKLTNLVRAGLFDSNKLPLLKRLLNKDVTHMTTQEKTAMSELLDKLLDEVLGNTQVYSKVKSNLQKESLDEKYEVAGDLPTVLILKRKAIRVYPDGQRVALYYNERLDTFVSVPYSHIGTSSHVAVAEGYAPGEEWKNVIGRFKHKETNKEFEYTSHDDPWAKQHGLNHKIYVGDEHRFGTVKGTVAHVAVDEKPDGSPKMEKWPLKKHSQFHLKESPSYNVDVEYGEHRKPPTERFSYKIKAKSGLHANSKAEKKLRDIKGDEMYHKKVLFTARPDGLHEHVLHTLKSIVANKQKMPIKFADGKTLSVDHQTANKIVRIHDTVHDQNKEKLVRMMNRSKKHFIKVANFAMKH